jgi:hypothetical protein
MACVNVLLHHLPAGSEAIKKDSVWIDGLWVEDHVWDFSNMNEEYQPEHAMLGQV